MSVDMDWVARSDLRSLLSNNKNNNKSSNVNVTVDVDDNVVSGDCATPDVLMASTVSVLEIYYGAKGLRKLSMTDFGKFAGELAEELGKRDSPQARDQQMLPCRFGFSVIVCDRAVVLQAPKRRKLLFRRPCYGV